MEKYYPALLVILFSLGIMFGSFMQHSFCSPVIEAQAVEIVQQRKMLRDQEDLLSWQTYNLVEYKRKIKEIKKRMRNTDAFLKKAGALYGIDFMKKQKEESDLLWEALSSENKKSMGGGDEN